MRSSSRFSRRFSSSSTADFGLASFIGCQYRAGHSAMQRALPSPYCGIIAPIMISDIRFKDFEDVLATAGSLADAAEAHGSLCGALCSMAPYKMQDWVNEILPDGAALSDESSAMLERVFTATE